MKTVMIVDDASTVRMFHKMLVSSPDRIIEEAENGVEALERAIGTQVDLFLIDVNMPKMDGYRLCKEIRRNEALRAVPIIMISTESANQDAERAHEPAIRITRPHADVDRRLAGLALSRHQAREGLDVDVE